ncbi:hypothetical protein GYMLUDRAFT_70949 [Collybiopsis luxurians FD-317 M1]|nr:hypothetical protein GYMLUDRAFT_70949 [Collybiopsis luxurians FD-317 M1]
MLLDLPDELLLHIVECITFIPELPNTPQFDLINAPPLPNQFTCRASELRALSVVNWRLRRVCLSPLFAHIRIRNSQDVERLRDHCSLCSMFTKSLKLEIPEKWQEILCQILPNLKQLSYIDSTACELSITLIRSMLEHPSISTVLVMAPYGLPAEYLDFNLSKMVLKTAIGFPNLSLNFGRCLDQGLKIARLVLHQPHRLDENFDLRTINGLQEVVLILHSLPVSFSWLPALTAAHPHLQRLWLSDSRRYFTDHTPPFIEHFVEECRQRGLGTHFSIKRVGLGRSITAPQQQLEWYVTDITLTPSPRSKALVELLQTVAFSFPKLDSLTLYLERHQGIYHIDDIIDALQSFPCLRYLYLHHLFERLEVKSRKAANQLTETVLREEVVRDSEDDIWRHASRVAKKVATLDAIYIEEFVQGPDAAHPRLLRGWLHVFDRSPDVDGELRLN